MPNRKIALGYEIFILDILWIRCYRNQKMWEFFMDLQENSYGTCKDIISELIKSPLLRI